MARPQMSGSDETSVKYKIEDTITRKAPEIKRPIPKQASANAKIGMSRTALPWLASIRSRK